MFPHHQNIDHLHNYLMLVRQVVDDTKYMWFFDVSEKQKKGKYMNFVGFYDLMEHICWFTQIKVDPNQNLTCFCYTTITMLHRVCPRYFNFIQQFPETCRVRLDYNRICRTIINGVQTEYRPGDMIFMVENSPMMIDNWSIQVWCTELHKFC